MIASVSFRNFKALRRAQLALTPFNLLIGANGSGKTSLIEALLQLHTLAKLPLADMNGSATRAGGPEIVFNFDPPHAALEARMGCVSELVCDLLHLTPADAPGWPALRADLSRIRGYVLDHEAIAAPAARADGAALHASGANLAAVLGTMRDTAPADFAALTREACRILPEFTGLELNEDAGGTVSFGLALGGEGVVPAANLSQGTRYALAILALSFDPAPPVVLCIEEIDRGIHPRMLREIRDALYRLSYPQSFGLARAPVQIIATTHSPYLLDLFRDHPEEIVITEKIGREATFGRLSDRADLAELLAEGSLGDMWFSGILGGVPEEP